MLAGIAQQFAGGGWSGGDHLQEECIDGGIDALDQAPPVVIDGEGGAGVFQRGAQIRD